MKKYLQLSLALTFILALTLSGCGGGNSGGNNDNSNPPNNPPGAPTVPTALTAMGSLKNIHLSWSASTGGGLAGYNVYRSVSESGSFTKLNSSPITSTSYDNPIDSPAGDGVLYYYKVTAAGDVESAASNTVKSMHGTRLAASYSSDFTTQASESPYVAEGTTVINGGDLTVAGSTKLYVLDNSTIDLEAQHKFFVYGLLRAAASSGAAHATFTAHKTGGLTDEDGFYLYFSNAESYNPADDSGSMLQYVQISNLALSTSFNVSGCGIKLDNVKISANVSGGGSYFYLLGGWAIIRNCLFEKMVFWNSTDLRSTPFEMKRNTFRNGYYSIYFQDLNNPGVNPGQIEQNDFDGSKYAYLNNMTGGSDVPLGNNFWNSGTGDPPIPPGTMKGGTVSISFNFNYPSAPLTSAPAGAGPNW